MAPMTLQRLRAILDAYGARTDRWPPDERDAARALLAASAEARALRDEAARLDSVLDLLPAPESSGDLMRRILIDAPAVRSRSRNRHWWSAAAAVPLAAAAALLIWLWVGEKSTPTPPAPLAISDLGVYTTPTDVLLVPPGMDLLRSRPSVGCEAGGLGCPQLDLPTERQSDLRSETRLFA